MRHANIEMLPDGGARVWAEYPNMPAALKAVELLLTINPDAFAPVQQNAQTLAYQEGVVADGGGVMPHDVAAALMRDTHHWTANGYVPIPTGETPADDDEVVFPRACPAGGCGED